VVIFYFLIVSPGCRWGAFILLGITGVGIYLLIQNDGKNTKAYQQQQATNEQKAVASIRPDDLVLSGVSLIPEPWGMSEWELKGTVTNNSQFNLGSIEFVVTIKDCSLNQACKIIGQERAFTMNDKGPLVPAGQVRLFSTFAIKFANMPAVSNPLFDYKITEIRAAF
jgi:hypothetical protein